MIRGQTKLANNASDKRGNSSTKGCHFLVYPADKNTARTNLFEQLRIFFSEITSNSDMSVIAYCQSMFHVDVDLPSVVIQTPETIIREIRI